MKYGHEEAKPHSLRRTLMRVGLFMGIVASVVIIARMITGRNQGM